MALVQFDRWSEDNDGIVRRLHVNPDSIASIEEMTRRRAYEGEQAVAILHFRDGTKTCVLDGDRKAVEKLTRP